jgi:hypothetical protein
MQYTHDRRINRQLSQYFAGLETLRWLQNDPASVHVVLTSVVGSAFVSDDDLKALAFERALGPIDDRIAGDREALRAVIDSLAVVPDFDMSIVEQNARSGTDFDLSIEQSGPHHTH